MHATTEALHLAGRAYGHKVTTVWRCARVAAAAVVVVVVVVVVRRHFAAAA